jgi:hypothetical protein
MITDFLTTKDVFCPHVLERYKPENGWLPNNPYGHFAWNFYDSKLLLTVETIIRVIGKKVYVNFDNETQRGFRCVKCQLIQDIFKKDRKSVV